MNPLTDPDFDLRDETVDDRPFLDALHRGVILQAMGARADDIDLVMNSLAGMQVRARDLAYAADWPEARRRTAWIGPERVGAIITSEGPAALHIVDIAVAPGERRRGVGRAMLEAVLREADTAGLAATARILVANAASRALFAAAGFHFQAEPDQLQVVAHRSTITNM